MKPVIIMLAFIVGAGVLYLAGAFFAHRKKVCPGCQKRGLETDGHASVLGTATDGEGKRYPYALDAYRCTECRLEWRSYNGGGLISKQAFDDGAREPIAYAKAKVKR